jgi:hypothetical protein
MRCSTARSGTKTRPVSGIKASTTSVVPGGRRTDSDASGGAGATGRAVRGRGVVRVAEGGSLAAGATDTSSVGVGAGAGAEAGAMGGAGPGAGTVAGRGGRPTAAVRELVGGTAGCTVAGACAGAAGVSTVAGTASRARAVRRSGAAVVAGAGGEESAYWGRRAAAASAGASSTTGAVPAGGWSEKVKGEGRSGVVATPGDGICLATGTGGRPGRDTGERGEGGARIDANCTRDGDGGARTGPGARTARAPGARRHAFGKSTLSSPSSAIFACVL